MIVALTLLVALIAAGIIAAAWTEAQYSTALEAVTVIPEEAETMTLSLTQNPDVVFADSIRTAYSEGRGSYADLAAEYNTSKSMVGRIVRREWRA